MRRIAAVVALATLACSGVAVPEPDVPVPEALPPEPVPVTLGVERLPEDLRGRIAALDGDLRAVTDPAEFATAWREGQALALALTDAFQAQHGDAMCADAAPDAVKLPAMALGCVAEGSQADVHLPVEPWRAAALRTPGNADDKAVELYENVYAAASVESFPAWMVQTWDYGGCSALGTGKILRILLDVDAALGTGDLFAPEIAVVRAGALGEILAADGHSQYCNGQSPMPDAELQQEARDILVQVRLTPEEKQAMEARIGALRGERFTGG